MSAELSSADRAVHAVLSRIINDGRIAYFLGFGSETFNLLTTAEAERIGRDPQEYAHELWSMCSPERPQS